jgi:hypothetical protein
VPLGPEMPVVVMAACVGAALLQPFTLAGPVRRAVLLATIAGALSAFFATPIGALFFTLEVPHRLGLEYYEVRQRCPRYHLRTHAHAHAHVHAHAPPPAEWAQCRRLPWLWSLRVPVYLACPLRPWALSPHGSVHLILCVCVCVCVRM